MKLIIDCQYFTPVILHQISTDFTHIVFDAYDRYQKVSFRNRAVVLGGNGEIMLSVPLIDGREQRRPMKDVRIANNADWQSQHFKTLKSCYNRSPWFQFFEHELLALYEKKFEWLMDWNLACWEWSVKKTGGTFTTEITESYQEEYDPAEWLDLRNRIRVQTLNQDFPNPVKYNQVFEDRHGFVPNCSVLDLIFCEGKNARSLLMKAQKQL
ncbi:WbqC family protein [Pseudoflavitalea sp. G-6-1-2]|uniref:WbqC family protein n=1 Tax=Pseudoflavitalea sp. G-6-1-2 TaxID=2728841 RepID=UPI00146E95E7|nr:WbqC family protein [Pseudoflavitalea sp. G-6-1-2]NML23628.1 WbqC family protein [Pseudoflavitalea sp. G-6-1-2]